jgi:hypothetical protein
MKRNILEIPISIKPLKTPVYFAFASKSPMYGFCEHGNEPSSALKSCHFLNAKELQMCTNVLTLIRGWVGPISGLDAMEERKSYPYRYSNSDLSAVQPVVFI